MHDNVHASVKFLYLFPTLHFQCKRTISFDSVNSKSDVGATGISGLFCLLRWHPGVSGAVFEHAHKSYLVQQMF